jgi:hypothetical protein
MRELARPAAWTAICTVLAIGVMGMGGFGGGRESGPPAREFRATVTDVDGQKMHLTGVTAGGDTSLDGELGRGHLRIPFDNITRITFQPAKEQRDRVRAEVQLREGEPIVLGLRSSTTFSGRVPGGAYQVRARDLQSVEFAR